MDLVYTTCAGSKCNDLELRYSIRSMVKHLHGFDRIFIIGHLPEFLQNVIHIPKDDPHAANRARNIYEKILAACRHEDVSDDFIYASDDHFLLQDHSVFTFPYYHCGSLQETANRLSKTNYYKNHVQNTCDALLSKGLPEKNFNVHSPIRYNKQQYIDIMTSYDWEVRRGYISKSLYCNSLLIQGVYLRDAKIHTPKTKTAIYRYLENKPMFSTNEHTINDSMREVLEELYPDVSPWERQ